jgi:chromosomal replication initiation ATPase DnaA
MIGRIGETLRLIDGDLSAAQPQEKPANSPNWMLNMRRHVERCLPSSYQKASLDDFGETVSAQVAAIDWTKRGIFIRGKTGTGKTHLASAIGISTMDPKHP